MRPGAQTSLTAAPAPGDRSDRRAPNHPRISRLRVGIVALAVFIGSAIVVLGTAEFGEKVVVTRAPQSSSLVEKMANWDGSWYAKIATVGYDYSPIKTSGIVYFPAYPLVSRAVMRLGGIGILGALAIVSNVFLLAAMLIWAMYVRLRVAGPRAGSVAVYAIIAMGVCPSTFFFHMAYTESMLLCLCVLSFYGMQRCWPPIVIALIIGLATATRSVGVALLPAFFLYLWDVSAWAPGNSFGGGSMLKVRSVNTAAMDPGASGETRLGPRIRRFSRSALLAGPLACWGLAAFMGFQLWRFGTPLAFGKAEMVWRVRASPESIGASFVKLITFEPIRNTYNAASPCYWGRYIPRNAALLNLNFANPIFFVATALLLVLGIIKGWLDRREAALGATLLLIPYVMQSCRQCTISEARFASIVFPAYLVVGHLLARLPRFVAVYLIACGCLMLAIYTAMFAGNYPAF